jgi:superfamily II DNA or RNA helicase
MANLEVWAKQRSPEPVDVIVTQKSVLQRDTTIRQALDKIKFNYLVVDECHDWVRGQPSAMSNQLNFLRFNLLPRAAAVFLVSGTPFVGRMQFDVIQTIKSLATPVRRARWRAQLNIYLNNQETAAVQCYTDEWLQELDEQWAKTSHLVKTQMLVPILLIRTPSTRIDGEPIMEDFMAKMKEKVDGDIEYNNALVLETQKRDNLLNKHEIDGASKTTRYTYARWCAYSSQVITRNWNTLGRENPGWWNNFTLKDACEYERGRRLVKILKSDKQAGKRTIVFASAVFHQQFAAHVTSNPLLTDK